MSTPIVPVPDAVLASEFPSLSDRSTGTYNSKAKAWADSENAMVTRTREIALTAENNAASAKEQAVIADTKAGETASDRQQTGLDRAATGQDRVQTGLDRQTVEQAVIDGPVLSVNGETGVVVLPPTPQVATSAQIRSLTTDNAVTPAKVSDALGASTPSGASNWTPDWATFITANWIVTANRTLANPTEGIPGTTRVVTIKANTSTERTISFGAYFKGELPEVKVTNTAFVTLFIYCVTATEFLVSDKGWTS